jgi:long-chain fatty acid transport protein
MTKFMARAALAASVSVLALGAAQAGGITNTSQSAVFNGMGYAGFAAPGSSSAATMFMNPATMTGFTRMTIDTNYTFGAPSTKMTGQFTGGAAALLNGGRPTSSGDVGMDYFVPASYVIVPINDRLVFGVSLNTTYGNTTKPDQLWTGSALAHTSKLRVITATPSLAYKINNEWSVGVGLQLQYASARQFGFPPAALGGPQAGILKADGFAAGWTAGVTWTPTKTTQIGLGWRSFVDQKVKGKVTSGGAVVDGAEGTLNLPNRVNLSIRQGINEKLDLLGSVEWQNYGRIGDAALKNLPAPMVPVLSRLPFGYSDGWMISLGGEYKYNQALTLRAGAAYEITPVKDAIRRVSLPDNDRIWLSTGFSYKVSERFDLNASYSFLHIKKANITTVVAAAGSTFNAVSKGHAHLISVGLTSKWGAPPAREAAVIRKY